ncbi:PREDICTED: endothelin-converting enzyme 2 isoform X2 [Nelumbo nucifera]|uniref:Endothelin-converting enzyme 2 isoform X2 n=1 Tax=Nelumbo nucifera TaxID=4432 RepID=A0A1U7Z8D4_NELNU|nr:PREDICTED: endothelin-converting enzyme 2 isoform X2 [Nelumbo nucifera]
MDEMGKRSPTDRTQRSEVGPSTALAYLDPQYWDQRFSSEEHYEWFKDYSHFRHLIQEHMNPKSSVGICSRIVGNVSVAVEKMQKRLLSKGYIDIKVLEADMLDLPFGNSCFDVVIEKGTMDVLFVDSGDPWNPRPTTVSKVLAMLEGVHRVLKPDGVFISISFGQPHFRRPLFESPEFTWSIEWKTFGDGFHYFFYILRKGRRLGDAKGSGQRSDIPSIYLLQEELEGEDYIFRTDVDELDN